MKRLLLLSFIVFNLSVASIGAKLYGYNQGINQFFTGLADESLIVSVDNGLTVGQKEKLESVHGISSVDYSNYNYYGTSGKYDNVINFTDSTPSYGGSFPFQLLDEDRFPLTSGKLPQNDQEVIITDQLAQVIESETGSDEIIGTKADGYTVVGTFDGESIESVSTFDKNVEDENGDVERKTFHIFNDSWITTKSLVNSIKPEDVIIQQNIRNAYRNGDNEYIIYDETTGLEEFDYVSAKKDGLDDYENPNTKKYGDTYDNIAYIQIEDANDMAAIKADIIQNLPDAKYIDNTTRLFDVTNEKTMLFKAVFFLIGLYILIYGVWFIKRK